MLRYERGSLLLLDQLKLPFVFEYMTIKDCEVCYCNALRCLLCARVGTFACAVDDADVRPSSLADYAGMLEGDPRHERARRPR